MVNAILVSDPYLKTYQSLVVSEVGEKGIAEPLSRKLQ